MINMEKHNTGKKIGFKISMLRSDLCDYSDEYIAVKGTVTVSANAEDNNFRNKNI